MRASVLVEVFVEAVGEAVLVDRSVRAALGARPVVGDEADQRVVEQAVRAQVLDDATDLVIGVREEAGEHLHHAARRGVARSAAAPSHAAHPRRARVQPVSAGHDAVRDLPREQRASRHASQPSSNFPTYGSIHSGGDLMRRVHRAGREPGEERLAGRRLLLVLHQPDRLVGEVLGEVVAVPGPRGGSIDVVVGLELGRPLVRVAAEEAVEALEAEAERPAVERTRRAPLPARREVPLADGERE